MPEINIININLTPALYIIATPIGNKKDITLRALETLKNLDIIYCEDTRTSKKLLDQYDIKTKLASCHEHNEEAISNKIYEQILSNKAIGLISDAGTPLINDPGFKLVRFLHEKNIKVISIPGASALTAALSIAGAPTDQFSFYGFFPIKKSNQENIINIIKTTQQTSVFYESPHRILKTLNILNNDLSSSYSIVLCKEITKIYENTISGTAQEIINHFDKNPSQLKGEFVILIYKNINNSNNLDISNISNKYINISHDQLLNTLTKFLSSKESAQRE